MSEVSGADGAGDLEDGGLDQTSAQIQEKTNTQNGDLNYDRRREPGGGMRDGSADQSLQSSMPISETRFHRLAKAIESNVIPRLLMAYRASEPSRSGVPCTDWHAAPDHVARLTETVLAGDVDAAMEFDHALRGEGAGIESLFLEVLAPTAHRLGDLWEQDRVDFTQVTSAMGQLTLVIRRLSRRALGEDPVRSDDRRALMASPPSEQHSFGLLMVSEFLRMTGWHVACCPALSRRSLIDTVRDDWFLVAGFSISGEGNLDWLVSSISALRRASRNTGIGVMVGGKYFLEHPDQVSQVGADFMAHNGREAVSLAEDFLKGSQARFH